MVEEKEKKKEKPTPPPVDKILYTTICNSDEE